MEIYQSVEFLPHKQDLLFWISQYGPIALFVFFALGIFALPFPEESLMVISGVLISEGELPFFSTIIACIAGSMVGITVSYIIGRMTGHYLLVRYGKWLGLTEKKLGNAHDWFQRYGKWTLLLGYFVPGVRHFIGVFAGMSKLSYHHFSLFAYAGALTWASTFLSIGYFFGDYWLTFYEMIESRFEYISIAFIVITLFVLFLKRKT